jgi:hypothetical protein
VSGNSSLKGTAPETACRHAHPWTFEVVIRAVAGAHVVGLTPRRRGRTLERRLLGVLKVLLPQLLANLVQPDARGGTGKVVSVVRTLAHGKLLR